MLPNQDQDSALPSDVAIVYAWDKESRKLAEALRSVDHYGVTLKSVTGTPPDSLHLGAQRLVACVLFVSEEACADPSFATTVSQCCDSRLLRADFRLFAWLAGELTVDELRKRAESCSPYEELLESVHFPHHRSTLTVEAVADALDQYLSELPEYRQQTIATSEMKRLTIGIRWGADVLMGSAVLAVLAGWICAAAQIRGAMFHWAMFGLGQLSFYLILALASLGSPAGLGPVGWAIRLGFPLATVPFLFLRSDLMWPTAHGF
jgi:hypothetical protein